MGTCQVKLNRGVIDSFNLIYGQAAAGESSKVMSVCAKN